MSSDTETISDLLTNLLLINDNIKEFSDKISIKLSSNTLLLLKTVLKKSPKSLDKIIKDINEILSDGKIDHKDIPNIINLVADFYFLDVKSIASKTIKVSDIVDFIQFLMKLVVDLDYVKVDDKEELFTIIDSSSSLLKMVIGMGMKDIKCCFPCFK